MSFIFVSYRRSDAPAHAGRIYDRLAERLGKDSVYMDLDSTVPGADFADVIEQTIAQCDALIAVIGRDWVSALRPSRRARHADGSEDWVRREIAAALARNIRVIPVLVQGAKMPSSAELPDDIKGLARRHAIELSETAWSAQLGLLMDALPVATATSASTGRLQSSSSRRGHRPHDRGTRRPSIRAGRQADALATYRGASQRLINELGLEPSPALRELEGAILAHHPDPGLPPRDLAATAVERADVITEPPTGTVTFLFSDVEGSTQLLRRLRGHYAEVLGEHQRLLRAAFDEHDGREVHTQGDAFFVAFARASDAIAAAVSAQRSLASHCWPEGVDVRVRMGVHTGEAEVRQDDYVGLDVHRAARICAAGHGGQVLISSSTRELVADQLPSDVALRDLGEHRLKDLDRPEHLFQLVVGDLAAEFPALASLSAGSGGANGLPPSPNRTIGRAEDVRAVVDRLRADGVQLLTLTGPGGVGKTRLGLEAARAVGAEFAAGARFVSLAALRRADDVPAAIVQSLGIVPVSGESPERAVTRFLSAKQLLLVLDNVEHLLPAAPFVSELLSACPALTVLATSREALALAGEQRYPVAPLALPLDEDDAQSLARVPAIALFCERVRAHDPNFRLGDANAIAVAEICRRIDGLPLAIELAAARCGLLSPSEIAERIEATLGALGSGVRDAPARQRTLRATVEWSHNLLSDAEKQCFARFAVFAGGATVEAAEAITGADLDTLDDLVAKNLLILRHDAHVPSRLGMLETIRAYATERFATAADQESIRERHYRHYLALAQNHGTEQTLMSAGGQAHLARLDADIENLHAALAHAVGQAGAEPALAMCVALGSYWLMRARYADALEWINQALNMPGTDAQPALRVRALCTKAIALWPLGRRLEQPATLAEAEAAARALADPLVLSHALGIRASFEAGCSGLDRADALANEALDLATAANDDWEIAMAAYGRAIAAPEITELRTRVDRAAAVLEDVGNVYYLAHLFAAAAYAALQMDGDRDAKEYVARATPTTRVLDNPFLWIFLRGSFGLAALLTGDTDAARQAFREELTLCRDLVFLPFASEGLAGLAAVSAVDGDDHRAACLVGAAAEHRYGQPKDPIDARLDETFLEPARTRHGADAWDAAAREGSVLSFEDAIAYALEEPRA
jgi:predicted ATPase/class 3 adenylate cyclase